VYSRKDNTALAEITRDAQKILKRLKGLRELLQPDETPQLNIPAIWDGGLPEQGGRSMPSDVVLTNQRILGYVLTTFPRTRLFFDALPLSSLTTVSLRQKSYEPLFRELLVSDGRRKVYIRAPRLQIAALYEALQTATKHSLAANAPNAENESQPASAAPIYGKQEMQGTFERSLLAIVLLFVGGLVLEIVGASAWIATSSVQVGLPLCIAGFVAFILSIVVRHQRQHF
jgi:hypothetical protein